VKPVRRPDSAVKGVAWPARLLDGLRALGGWLVPPILAEGTYLRRFGMNVSLVSL
jgi:hypothetical protein